MYVLITYLKLKPEFNRTYTLGAQWQSSSECTALYLYIPLHCRNWRCVTWASYCKNIFQNPCFATSIKVAEYFCLNESLNIVSLFWHSYLRSLSIGTQNSHFNPHNIQTNATISRILLHTLFSTRSLINSANGLNVSVLAQRSIESAQTTHATACTLAHILMLTRSHSRVHVHRLASV